MITFSEKKMTNYQTWIYSYRKNLESMFTVTTSTNIPIPQTLFKYYALSDNNIDAVTNFYLYASHPYQLNDPLDCSDKLLDFSSCSIDDLKSLYSVLYQQFLNIYGEINALKAVASSHFTTLFFRKIGIISLCNNGINPILWANYAKGNGFCVEFNHQKLSFAHCGPFPMHYVDSLSPVIVNNNVGDAALIQTNVKLSCWSKEQEYRILAISPEGLDFATYETGNVKSKTFNFGDEHNRKLRYPACAIKTIILAEKFINDSDTRIYQVSTDEYEIVLINSPLKERLLTMLSNPKFPSAIKIAFREKNGVIKLCAIQIYHISEKTYRIIEI